MCNFTQHKTRFIIFALAVCSTILSACGKTETIDTTISYVRVVNGSPSLSTFNVYLSGNIINSAALPFLGSTSYVSRSSGAYGLKFTSASSTDALHTKDITLNPSSNYSYYLVNKPGQLDGFLVADDVSLSTSDKAYIRFINLSVDAPALDLAKTGAATSLINNKAYKTVSSFITVDAGTISLDVKDTATGAIKTTKADVTLAAGFHYDIICGGLVTPANDTEKPLSLQVLVIK
ncbi:DUF4397 domain-containing protein [Pedobacter aquatilis]|uniref:DUF4397 domain-containing protein n=1 Tax=Pedobacter aquatilis TaxID=351343 RepID=UPI0025B2A607|nr:DUF4397 domain-containing protein [Pedobacter aquatilis]MDN3585546.1 DUF4397 domain-containing protein [Pedobacter aquatilis]